MEPLMLADSAVTQSKLHMDVCAELGRPLNAEELAIVAGLANEYKSDDESTLKAVIGIINATDNQLKKIPELSVSVNSSTENSPVAAHRDRRQSFRSHNLSHVTTVDADLPTLTSTPMGNLLERLRRENARLIKHCAQKTAEASHLQEERTSLQEQLDASQAKARKLMEANSKFKAATEAAALVSEEAQEALLRLRNREQQLVAREQQLLKANAQLDEDNKMLRKTSDVLAYDLSRLQKSMESSGSFASPPSIKRGNSLTDSSNLSKDDNSLLRGSGNGHSIKGTNNSPPSSSHASRARVMSDVTGDWFCDSAGSGDSGRTSGNHLTFDAVSPVRATSASLAPSTGPMLNVGATSQLVQERIPLSLLNEHQVRIVNDALQQVTDLQKELQELTVRHSETETRLIQRINELEKSNRELSLRKVAASMELHVNEFDDLQEVMKGIDSGNVDDKQGNSDAQISAHSENDSCNKGSNNGNEKGQFPKEKSSAISNQFPTSSNNVDKTGRNRSIRSASSAKNLLDEVTDHVLDPRSRILQAYKEKAGSDAMDNVEGEGTEGGCQRCVIC
jgi:molybdopterin-guanine dinucleotide biosynthesis protein A